MLDFVGIKRGCSGASLMPGALPHMNKSKARALPRGVVTKPRQCGSPCGRLLRTPCALLAAFPRNNIQSIRVAILLPSHLVLMAPNDRLDSRPLALRPAALSRDRRSVGRRHRTRAPHRRGPAAAAASSRLAPRHRLHDRRARLCGGAKAWSRPFTGGAGHLRLCRGAGLRAIASRRSRLRHGSLHEPAAGAERPHLGRADASRTCRGGARPRASVALSRFWRGPARQGLGVDLARAARPHPGAGADFRRTRRAFGTSRHHRHLGKAR